MTCDVQRHVSQIKGPWSCPKTALSALGGRRTALSRGRAGNSNFLSPLLVRRCQELQDDQSVSEAVPY